VASRTRARAFYLTAHAFIKWNKAVIGSARREMSLLHRRPSRIIPRKSSSIEMRFSTAASSFDGFLSGYLSIAHIRFRDLPRGERRGRREEDSCNSWSFAGGFCGETRKATQRVPPSGGWAKTSPLCSSCFLSRRNRGHQRTAPSAQEAPMPLFYCISVMPIRWSGSLIGIRNRISRWSLALDRHEIVKRWWW